MDINKKVKALRDAGVPLWSISRLNTFNTCQYSYYKTYIEGNRGTPNIYSYMGNIVHDAIERMYNGEEVDLTNELEDGIMEAEMLGFGFPTDNIGNSWKADMKAFCADYKKMDLDIKTEEEILVEIAPGIWMFGYSDATVYDNEYADVYDWKTSSEFKGDKLLEAGRQLCVYALAKKAQGFTPRKVAWNMLKYCVVSYKLKNGNTKSTVCNRGKWVSKMEKPIRSKFNNDVDDFEIDMLMMTAIEENKIEGILPQYVVDEFEINDYILEYDITEDVINETIEYIVKTVKQIESKVDMEMDWPPIEITDKNSFYCGQLCNHNATCKFYKQYLENRST